MAQSNEYDLNVILDAGISEAQVQTEKDAIAAQVEKFAGEIKGLDEWGNKRLAYPIRKQNEGYYLIYDLALPPEAPKALEAALRLRDNVMRVLAIRRRPEWRTRKAPEPREQAA